MKVDMPSIAVANLRKYYGQTVALSGISFDVKEGTFFGCFGPNGAGKTTLVKILTGQIPATDGTVKVMGIDSERQGLQVRSMVGIVPEAESPASYLTAGEFLYFVGRVRKVDDLEGKIDHWLRYFDMEDSRGTLCKDLSKGMRQKVMLAAAFIHEPKLLFLDEPFINLDPIYQKKLRDYLLQLREEGRTIFLCSHILEIAQRLCEEVMILDRGAVVARDSLAHLASQGEDLESMFMRLVGGKNASPS